MREISSRSQRSIFWPVLGALVVFASLPFIIMFVLSALGLFAGGLAGALHR